MASALAAERATDVLRHMARHPQQRLTLTALSNALEIGLAAMHGVLEALVRSGFVERDEAKTYRLGPEAAVLGSAARSQDHALRSALRAALAVSTAHEMGASVVACRDPELVVLDAIGPRSADTELARPGWRLHHVAPVGAVFMAGAPAHETLAWMARSGMDGTDDVSRALRAAMGRIRSLGWMATVPAGTGAGHMLYDPAMHDAGPDVVIDAMLAPVVDTTGVARRADLAIALTGFAAPMSRSAIESLGDQLVSAARLADERVPISGTIADPSER